MEDTCGWPRLTERERQVLARVLCGLGSKGIAIELGVSVRTVSFHRANIRGKFRSVAVRAVLARLEREHSGGFWS